MKSSIMKASELRRMLGVILVMWALPFSGADLERAAWNALIAGPNVQATEEFSNFIYRTVGFPGEQNQPRMYCLTTTTGTCGEAMRDVKAGLGELVHGVKSAVQVWPVIRDHHVMLFAIQYPEITETNIPAQRWVRDIRRGLNKKFPNCTPRRLKPACRQLMGKMLRRSFSTSFLYQAIHASYKNYIISYIVILTQKQGPEKADTSEETIYMKQFDDYLKKLKNDPPKDQLLES